MMNRLLALVLAMVLCLFALPAFAAAELQVHTVIMEETVIPDDTTDDNDERFKLYLQRELSPFGEMYGGISMFGVAAGARLNAEEKELYEALKAGAEEIANGTRNSAQFTFTRQFTAAELGLNGFFVRDDNGSIVAQFSDEALAKIRSAFYGNVDYGKLLKALLSDCPYEFYWFDKTKGMGSQQSRSGSDQLIECKLVVDFVVATKFKSGSEYQINTNLTSVAAQTKNAAQAIVSKYSNQSVYEKLEGYKTEICDLVSYNHTAAEDNNYFSDTDSDPWQMIYVFDGDPSTNVVCEGYSKAFQYLCDMSDFGNADICCYSVSGTMDGGAHMWNIVTMDDGKNYLVDVTNCDSGSVGNPDKLFLKKPASGSAESGYTFNLNGGIAYVYEDKTMALWGTGAGDILTLADEDYAATHTCDFKWVAGSDTTDTHHTLTCTCSQTTQEAHNWTYTASGSKITEQCGTCGRTGGMATISAPSDLTYSGSAKEASLNFIGMHCNYPTIQYTGSLTDRKPVKAGSYTAKVTIGGATASVEYTVLQKALTPTVMLSQTEFIYTGSAHEPTVSVMDGDVTIDPIEYNVYCENNIHAGTAKITVRNANGGNYVLAETHWEYQILPATLTLDMVTLSADSMVYTGSELEPEVTVSSPAKATDYDVSYSNNKEVGTAKVTVTGKGDFTGTVEKTFKITAHEHSWTYSASGNTITATCSGAGSCEVANKTATVTVTNGTHTYDGTPKAVTVTQSPADMFTGVTVQYAIGTTTYDTAPIDAGEYTVRFTLGGVTATDTMTISPLEINPTVVMDNSVCTYDGTKKQPPVYVKDEDDNVLAESEYAVSYMNNIDAGTATVTVSDAEGGNYALTETAATFTIQPATLTPDMVTLSADSMVHIGSELKPGVTVIFSGMTLVENADYTVAYSNNTEVGTAKVTVTGKGNFTGMVEKAFTITKHEHVWLYNVEDTAIKATCSGEGECEVNHTVTVSVTSEEWTYDGTPKAVTVTQNPEYMFSGVTVQYDIDTTTYDTAPIDAGEYTVRFTLGGVTAETTMTIARKRITPTVTLSQTSYPYDGYAKYPEVTVMDGSTVLEETDYWLDRQDNTYPGTSTIIVHERPEGNYTFEDQTATFTIEPIPLTDDMVILHAHSMVHTGSPLTPGVTVAGLTQGTDYTVAYENNMDIGTATVIVTGVGNYGGTVTKTFEIKAHEHDWSYAAEGNVITATCSGAGTCEVNTATVTVTGGTYTYDGEAKQATVTQNPANTFASVQMVYTDNKLPVNAGEHTVGVKLGNVTATDTLTINRKEITPTVTLIEPTRQRVYTGAGWEPAVRVYDGQRWLDASEYIVLYENNVNAGTATVTVKNASGGNYKLGAATVTFTISPATLTDEMVTLSASAMEYTGGELEPAVTVRSPAQATDYTVTYSNNTNVGTATVTVTGRNNFIGTVTKKFEITSHVHNWTYRASDNVITAECGCETEGNTVTVTVTGGTYTYDGTVKQAAVTQNPAGVFSDVSVVYDAEPKDARSYTATIALGGARATAQIVINPRAVTVTAEAKSKTYGDADPQLTYQANDLVPGETLAGALARDAGEDAGEYKITQGTLTNDNNPNYAISFTGAMLTISKKPAAAAPIVTGTYERDGSTYTYTVTAIDGAEYRMDEGDWQDSNVFAGIAPNSSHTFSARIKESQNQMVGEEGTTQSITFDKLQGVGTVTIAGWTYGQSAHSPVPVSETNGTDNVTYLYESTDGKGYSADNAPANAGSYRVTATFPATDEYHACTATAEFTIAKAIPSIGEVTDLTATYGDLLSSVQLPNGWAWENGAAAVGNAGSNAFSAVYTPDDQANYEQVKTSLTVTVNPKSIAADFSAVAASYPYTGQGITPAVKVMDGTSAVAAGEYTVTYSGNVEVGTATITVTDVQGGNYTVSGEKQFNIVKAAAPVMQPVSMAVLRELDTTGNAVDLAAKLPMNRGETTYQIKTNGTNELVKNAAVSTDGVFTFDTVKSDAPSEAVYVITAVMQNYADAEITVKISLTDKTPVTISGVAAASGLVYQAAAQAGYTGMPSAAPYTGAFDVTYTGMQADGTAYGPSEAAPVNAGSYSVVIAVPGDAAYIGSTELAFEIGKALLTIRANDLTALVGQEMPAAGYTAEGLCGSDELTVEPTLSCEPDMTKVDVYPITVSGAQASANYEITYQAGSLFVVTGGAASVSSQIVPNELTAVPQGLVSTEFNTVEKIIAEQARTLIEGNPDFTQENMMHIDAVLQFSLDGGNSWINATEENFPAGGLVVRLDYPEGTGKDTHDFIVSHMFTITSERLGTVAGETETPPVTELEGYMEFRVKSLSPICIAWKESEDVQVQDAIESLPKTGDSSHLFLWLGLLAVSLCAFAAGRKVRA